MLKKFFCLFALFSLLLTLCVPLSSCNTDSSISNNDQSSSDENQSQNQSVNNDDTEKSSSKPDKTDSTEDTDITDAENKTDMTDITDITDITDKVTEKPDATDDSENVILEDVTRYNMDKFIYPIWDGDISYAEAAFVREAEDLTVKPIELLYPIEEIISVRSADLSIEYVNGKDYYVEDGKLHIIEWGDIPILKYNDYFFKLSDEEHEQNNLSTKFPAANNRGWGYIRAEIGQNKPGMSQWTLAVTYTHSAESVVNAPEDKSANFEKLISKLEAGEDITLVSTGDSITDAWSASGKSGVGIEPKCPPYNRIIESYIRNTYQVRITHHNVGVSGSNTNGGVGKLGEICEKNPDLVLIAFGMNDGCGIAPAQYISNINKMVSTIEEKCPDACIVVVSTCLPNEKVAWAPGGNSILKYHIDYVEYLQEAEKNWNNASLADVTTVNVEMFERKVYQDVAGSNSNHPNDYMHRIYAQVILRTVFGDYYGN